LASPPGSSWYTSSAKRGIEIDPTKNQSAPGNASAQKRKEIRGFLGQVQYISRFIAKLTMICEPIFKKLRATNHSDWDEDCQEAFNRVKEILSEPPVLMPPQPGIPLSLYLTVTNTAMGQC